MKLEKTMEQKRPEIGKYNRIEFDYVNTKPHVFYNSWIIIGVENKSLKCHRTQYMRHTVIICFDVCTIL